MVSEKLIIENIDENEKKNISKKEDEDKEKKNGIILNKYKKK